MSNERCGSVRAKCDESVQRSCRTSITTEVHFERKRLSSRMSTMVTLAKWGDGGHILETFFGSVCRLTAAADGHGGIMIQLFPGTHKGRNQIAAFLT